MTGNRALVAVKNRTDPALYVAWPRPRIQKADTVDKNSDPVYLENVFSTGCPHRHTFRTAAGTRDLNKLRRAAGTLRLTSIR